MTEKPQNSWKNLNLTPRQLKSIPLLAVASSVSAGCRQAKMSVDLYRKWMEDTVFREALSKAQDEIVEEAFSLLKGNSALAVSTLSALAGATEFPAIQRASANDLLNQLVKFKEAMALEARISDLEQKLAQGTKT